MCAKQHKAGSAKDTECAKKCVKGGELAVLVVDGKIYKIENQDAVKTHIGYTITVTGKVIRETGKGLIRMDETKTASGRRTLPLPRFAIETLTERRALPYLGEQDLIFPSTAGTLRDPNNFGRLWRTVRDELGVPEVTTHSFRKTVATLIDDQGLSARIGADHLGHAKVSMTQDRYMARGKVHTQVADVLDDAINDA